MKLLERRERERERERKEREREREQVVAARLVVDGDEWVVRREGARAALAVHEQRVRAARLRQVMLLHLRDVVRHVVHQVHVQVVRRAVEQLRESLRPRTFNSFFVIYLYMRIQYNIFISVYA